MLVNKRFDGSNKKYITSYKLRTYHCLFKEFYKKFNSWSMHGSGVRFVRNLG